MENKFLVKNLESYKSHLIARASSLESIKSLSRFNDLSIIRSKQITERNEITHSINEISNQIGAIHISNSVQIGDIPNQILKLKNGIEILKLRLNEISNELKSVETEVNDISSYFPNWLDPSVPVGVDSSFNIEVYQSKLVSPSDSFTLLQHDEIMKNLGMFGPLTSAKISGSRFPLLISDLSKLERCLFQFMLETHTKLHGYTELSLPVIAKNHIYEGTGHLPKFKDDLFEVKSMDSPIGYLIPTGEVSIMGMFHDQILERCDVLPLKFVTGSLCFRGEVMSHGRDTRGISRNHQFGKVELVQICDEKTSNAVHEDMVKHCEVILDLLELPYRKILLCSGDTGLTARKTYDLEIWLPGEKIWREISSISNCGDYQTKRLGLRVRTTNKKTVVEYPHSLNGSGLAVGRTMIGILENYQTRDGCVKVPKVLQPFMNQEIIKPLDVKIIK